MSSDLLLKVIVGLSLAVSTPVSASSSDVTQALTATDVDKLQSSVNHSRAKASIVIAAPVEVVWRAIHEERNHDPDVADTTVVSEQGNVIVLEQTYRHIPIFGTVVCRTKNKESLYKRIDYSLDYSDHFRAMEGSWILTPLDSGGSTYLELSSFLDAGVGIPRMFYVPFAPGRLLKRLKLVKRLAEKEQAVATCRPPQ